MKRKYEVYHQITKHMKNLNLYALKTQGYDKDKKRLATQKNSK